MNTNFSDFIDPISSSQPAGINIEYDTRFISIQDIAEGKPEQQYGDVIIEAEEPDWNSIEKLCRQLLSESKDIRAFCLYTQALTANYGLQGFQTGCKIIYANLEAYWPEIYPLLTDEDNEFDPFYRLNSIGLLIADNGILEQLNQSKVLYDSAKKNYLTIKQVVAVLVNNELELYPAGKEKLLQDLKVAYESGHEELIALKESLESLNKIEKIFQSNLTDQFVDFSIIKRPLEIINEVLVADTMTESTQTDIKSDDLGGEVLNRLHEVEKPSSSSGTYDWKDAKISNRKDVNIILDKLILYFRLKEPSHPAPLFIGRLQKLMDMDFYQIIKNISPGSLEDLDIIIGKDSEEAVSDEDD